MSEYGVSCPTDVRIVVVDETRGVQHSLATMGRRFDIDVRSMRARLGFEGHAVKHGQRRIPVNTGNRLHGRAGQAVAATGNPVRDRRNVARQPSVAIRFCELLNREVRTLDAAFSRTIAKHQVGKVEVELVRWDIWAFRHKAHVAQGAGINDSLVVAGRD